jgi:hypothetical protein
VTDSEWKADALALLNYLEYRTTDGIRRWCIVCGKDKADGHKEDCQLAKLIRGAEGK